MLGASVRTLGKTVATASYAEAIITWNCCLPVTTGQYIKNDGLRMVSSQAKHQHTVVFSIMGVITGLSRKNSSSRSGRRVK